MAGHHLTDWTLEHAERHPVPVRGCWRCSEPARRAKADEAHERALEDARAIDDCELRDPSVRGIPAHQLHGRRCYMCGKPLRDPTTVKQGRRLRWCSDACSTLYWANHGWGEARHRAKMRDRFTCVRCGDRTVGNHYVDLEVNHKDPLAGRGYHESCAHHQDKLETLCHACHVPETKAQGRARRQAARVLPGVEPLTLELASD